MECDSKFSDFEITKKSLIQQLNQGRKNLLYQASSKRDERIGPIEDHIVGIETTLFDVHQQIAKKHNHLSIGIFLQLIDHLKDLAVENSKKIMEIKYQINSWYTQIKRNCTSKWSIEEEANGQQFDWLLQFIPELSKKRISTHGKY